MSAAIRLAGPAGKVTGAPSSAGYLFCKTNSTVRRGRAPRPSRKKVNKQTQAGVPTLGVRGRRVPFLQNELESSVAPARHRRTVRREHDQTKELSADPATPGNENVLEKRPQRREADREAQGRARSPTDPYFRKNTSRTRRASLKRAPQWQPGPEILNHPRLAPSRPSGQCRFSRKAGRSISWRTRQRSGIRPYGCDSDLAAPESKTGCRAP